MDNEKTVSPGQKTEENLRGPDGRFIRWRGPGRPKDPPEVKALKKAGAEKMMLREIARQMLYAVREGDEMPVAGQLATKLLSSSDERVVLATLQWLSEYAEPKAATLLKAEVEDKSGTAEKVLMMILEDRRRRAQVAASGVVPGALPPKSKSGGNGDREGAPIETTYVVRPEGGNGGRGNGGE